MKIVNYPINCSIDLSLRQCSHWIMVVLVCLQLTACATNNQVEPASNNNDKAATTASDSPVLQQIPADIAENIGLQQEQTDPQVIEHVLAGEFLGGQGDLQGAAEEYALAAAITDDVQIAERATRIGLQAQAWQAVLQSAQRWLELADDNREALQGLAIAHLELSEAEKATAALVNLITSNEPRSRGWQLAGSVLANASETELANDVLLSLVNRDDLGDDADGWYGQSVMAWRLGDLDRAKSLALKAANGTRRLDILEWAAQIAFAADDVDAAVGAYQRALQIVPGDRDLTLALAEVLKRDGQVAAALEALNGLGDNTEALYTRAAYQLESDNRPAAEEIYQQLSQLDVSSEVVPTDGDPTTTLSNQAIDPKVVHAFYSGQLAEQLDYKQQALDWYLQANQGEYANPAVLRAAALMTQLDRLEDAQMLLQPLQNSDNEDIVINAFITESNLLQQAGLADQAVQRLTVGLGRLSSNIDLLYARSLAAAADKDVDLAEQDLRRIIRENPDNSAALNALGYTLTDLTDRHDEALHLIEKALQLNPTDAATLDSMGWVNYRLGNLTEAEGFLRQAFALDGNAEIGAHLGEVLWQQGAHQEARDIWQQASAEEGLDQAVLSTTLERLDVIL